MSTMRKKKSNEKHAEEMSEKEKIQDGRHHDLDHLKTAIFIELIQINACVIQLFILASNDTTNKRVTGAASLK